MGVSFLKTQTEGSKSWVALYFAAEAFISRASSVVDAILISGGSHLEKEGRRRKPAAGGKIGFLRPLRASLGDGTLGNGLPASRSTSGWGFSIWWPREGWDQIFQVLLLLGCDKNATHGFNPPD